MTMIMWMEWTTHYLSHSACADDVTLCNRRHFARHAHVGVSGSGHWCLHRGCPDLSERQSSSLKRIHTDLLREGRFFFHLEHRSRLACHQSPWSITTWIWSWLGWLEKGLSNNFSFWLNPIPESNRDVMRSLVDVEVTSIHYPIKLLQFSV